MPYNKLSTVHSRCCFIPMRVGCSFYEPVINGLSRVILIPLFDCIMCVVGWTDTCVNRLSMGFIITQYSITYCNLCVAMHDFFSGHFFWQTNNWVGIRKPNHWELELVQKNTDWLSSVRNSWKLVSYSWTYIPQKWILKSWIVSLAVEILGTTAVAWTLPKKHIVANTTHLYNKQFFDVTIKKWTTSRVYIIFPKHFLIWFILSFVCFLAGGFTGDDCFHGNKRTHELQFQVKQQ